MKYERIKYPDGQVSAKVTDFSGPLEIHERINSYEDLFFIRALADVLNNHFTNPLIYLNIPCLFSQRSDRRFSENQSFDLKLVAEVINSCKFERVYILDPHSPEALNLIDRSVKVGIRAHVISSLNSISSFTKEPIVLISPDAGAYKKVFALANDLNHPVVAAVKYRDEQGKIDLQFTGDVKDKTCLIVDDYCDGGFTFITLAGKLKEGGAKRVYLYVTHGLFSKGIKPLEEAGLSHIYCTNSIKDIDYDLVTQFKVI